MTLNCTCKDAYRAELGQHEGVCALSVMRSGSVWIKRRRFGEWESIPVPAHIRHEYEEVTA